ncbi:MAG: hypothetical protein COZ28_00090 [Candidatus Moranbacteria bacterium CG_4_10_14_3_um_filter_44_15]|nr:MAG: hypothetical protein COS72_03330 [Candidatus Moranbacteria bacterium CG06_land_8_20_14_3_00_43_56]PIX91238.1 MAG: hypothetical protein COZ28_00090 [Candidatus Moranbacteria bacterium CG_4_10_14_3_um_filter_44_15]PJA85707.1 MAG: hypothetical protein CO142_02870 [Candidatus Moranbacteria bacterium CG_4_9_14_3_um_filter_44_28]
MSFFFTYSLNVHPTFFLLFNTFNASSILSVSTSNFPFFQGLCQRPSRDFKPLFLMTEKNNLFPFFFCSSFPNLLNFSDLPTPPNKKSDIQFFPRVFGKNIGF